jgi:hypothetical protein
MDLFARLTVRAAPKSKDDCRVLMRKVKAKQVPPLRCAPVGMTNPQREIAKQQAHLFIPSRFLADQVLGLTGSSLTAFQLTGF